MKNKKIIFGIIFLFAITGICSIQNVSAIENPQYTETIPPGAKIYLDQNQHKFLHQVELFQYIEDLLMQIHLEYYKSLL